jgi:hypothetical protein
MKFKLPLTPAHLLAGAALIAMSAFAGTGAAWSQQPQVQQPQAQQTEPEPEEEAEPEAAATAAKPDAEPLPDNIDFGALAVPLDMPYTPPKLKQAAPANTGGSAAVWSRNDKSNGTVAVTVNKPVSSFWDVKAGVDLDVATPSSPLRTPETLPEKLASDARNEQSQGSAWMSARAPGVPYLSDQVSLEARMNPDRDARLGTTLSKALPLSDQLSLTLKQGFYITQHEAIPGLPGGVGHGRSFDSDRSAQISFAETGTSFLAGQTRAPTGDRWLNSIGAEQKLFGGLSITGAVTEKPEGFSSKSISAGFKKSW